MRSIEKIKEGLKVSADLMRVFQFFASAVDESGYAPAAYLFNPAYLRAHAYAKLGVRLSYEQTESLCRLFAYDEYFSQEHLYLSLQGQGVDSERRDARGGGSGSRIEFINEIAFRQISGIVPCSKGRFDLFTIVVHETDVGVADPFLMYFAGQVIQDLELGLASGGLSLLKPVGVGGAAGRVMALPSDELVLYAA